ncbi:MAG TPA: hypothetical protein VD908_13575 [Cytophagales bacterium]|nr:hypothetical protein [Cytophagales bacterium]
MNDDLKQLIKVFARKWMDGKMQNQSFQHSLIDYLGLGESAQDEELVRTCTDYASVILTVECLLMEDTV